MSWEDILEENSNQFAAILSLKPVDAIVITQDCDAGRGELLSLCQIMPIKEEISEKVDKRHKQLMRIGDDSPRLFYLPIDEKFNINERMTADFRLILSVKRADMEFMKKLRIGRLNDVAYQHFRERLAQFFRRYPVNGWYPLTKEEFESYRESQSEKPEPYPWQT